MAWRVGSESAAAFRSEECSLLMALALPPSALFTFESITLFVSAAAVAEVVVVVLAEVAVEFDAIEVIVVDVAVVVD